VRGLRRWRFASGDLRSLHVGLKAANGRAGLTEGDSVESRASGRLARWQKHDHNSAIDQPNEGFERAEFSRILNNSANTPQTASNLYSHNSATNAITIRPVTTRPRNRVGASLETDVQRPLRPASIAATATRKATRSLHSARVLPSIASRFGNNLQRTAGEQREFVFGLTKKCRTEKYFCPTCFCQQRTWSAARIQLMVRGGRLVHSMLLSFWHNMHAQRGSELGNGTADEHSRDANESLYGPNVAITVGRSQPFTHRRPVGRSSGQQGWPIFPISVYQCSFAVPHRPHRGQPHPVSPPSPTRAASATRHQFATGSSDELTTNRRRTARHSS
jgi:hypothetical protein